MVLCVLCSLGGEDRVIAALPALWGSLPAWRGAPAPRPPRPVTGCPFSSTSVWMVLTRPHPHDLHDDLFVSRLIVVDDTQLDGT